MCASRHRNTGQRQQTDGSAPPRGGPTAAGGNRIDRNRYRRIRWYFAKLLIQMVGVDMLFDDYYRAFPEDDYD